MDSITGKGRVWLGGIFLVFIREVLKNRILRICGEAARTQNATPPEILERSLIGVKNNRLAPKLFYLPYPICQ
jgi:hypothetical protein